MLDCVCELIVQSSSYRATSSRKLRCTDENLRLYANATACADEREPESCRMLFPTPYSSSPGIQKQLTNCFKCLCTNELYAMFMEHQCSKTCGKCEPKKEEEDKEEDSSEEKGKPAERRSNKQQTR
uniref:ShKT domain-containing protein n=1 Tax=Ditylenchus dipsaci TaxID=166011 RepID=A0A915DWJ0_9BILA